MEKRFSRWLIDQRFDANWCLFTTPMTVFLVPRPVCICPPISPASPDSPTQLQCISSPPLACQSWHLPLISAPSSAYRNLRINKNTNWIKQPIKSIFLVSKFYSPWASLALLPFWRSRLSILWVSHKDQSIISDAMYGRWEWLRNCASHVAGLPC